MRDGPPSNESGVDIRFIGVRRMAVERARDGVAQNLRFAEMLDLFPDPAHEQNRTIQDACVDNEKE
jgi:hypothetical protein